MFNLGFTELLILGALALVFIGPKELPEVARFIGRMMNEFRRATSDLSSNILNPPSPRDTRRDQGPSDQGADASTENDKPSESEQKSKEEIS